MNVFLESSSDSISRGSSDDNYKKPKKKERTTPEKKIK